MEKFLCDGNIISFVKGVYQKKNFWELRVAIADYMSISGLWFSDLPVACEVSKVDLYQVYWGWGRLKKPLNDP